MIQTKANQQQWTHDVGFERIKHEKIHLQQEYENINEYWQVKQ